MTKTTKTKAANSVQPATITGTVQEPTTSYNLAMRLTALTPYSFSSSLEIHKDAHDQIRNQKWVRVPFPVNIMPGLNADSDDKMKNYMRTPADIVNFNMTGMELSLGKSKYGVPSEQIRSGIFRHALKEILRTQGVVLNRKDTQEFIGYMRSSKAETPKGDDSKTRKDKSVSAFGRLMGVFDPTGFSTRGKLNVPAAVPTVEVLPEVMFNTRTNGRFDAVLDPEENLARQDNSAANDTNEFRELMNTYSGILKRISAGGDAISNDLVEKKASAETDIIELIARAGTAKAKEDMDKNREKFLSKLALKGKGDDISIKTIKEYLKNVSEDATSLQPGLFFFVIPEDSTFYANVRAHYLTKDEDELLDQIVSYLQANPIQTLGARSSQGMGQFQVEIVKVPVSLPLTREQISVDWAVDQF